MEAYKTKCRACRKIRFWVGYKTGLGKTPEQLQEMKREQTTCIYCGSHHVETELDRESKIGREFDAMDTFATATITSLISQRSGNMLELLHSVEIALPTLLRNELLWKSMYVDYHHPFVERLWCEWFGNRVYLHRINPCNPGEALFHPHPWPSAMKVLAGGYEMTVGYGKGEMAPPIATRLLLGAGSEYEMTEPDAWHAVRPLTSPSISLMVTGTPWERSSPRSSKPLVPLTEEKRQEIFAIFRSHY